MNPDLDSIVRALDRLAAVHQKGVLDWVGTAAIVLTLFALIWYTCETRKLRKATEAQTKTTADLLKEAQQQNETSMNLVQQAQRQNEMAVMPILAIAVCGPPSLGPNDLVFTNIGTGPAFNVSIDGCKSNGAELRFEFGETVIAPGGTHKLPFELRQAGQPPVDTVEELCRCIILEILTNNPLRITARCRSASSIDYAFTFGFSPHKGRLKVAFEGMKSVPRAQVFRS